MDPRKPFFISLADANMNGTLDTDCQMPRYFETMDEAVEHAKDGCDDDGLGAFVYECRPVRWIHRGKSKVKVLAEPVS